MLLTLLAAACGPGLQEYEETRELVGTIMTVTVLCGDEEVASRAMEAAFQEVRKVDALMSTYIEDSEISILNREGSYQAGPDLRFVIERALHYSELSGGAFDITVKPLLELYGESFQGDGQPPTAEEVEAARALMGADRVRLEEDSIALAEGTRITLDGIAKGYAIDLAVAALEEHGIRRALVNVGGDMRALGDKHGGPWKVAMQNPRDANELLAVFPLIDKAVATSGDYERYFEPTMKYHHIIDPRTGFSTRELISVTVVADTALDADSLATAVIVLGKEKGMELVESLEGVEVFMITEDRQFIWTSGLDFTPLPER